jgi:hypothetical protein
VALVSAFPFTSLSCADANCTVPGPRNFAHITVIPTVSPRRLGNPSSVADTLSVAPDPL